jgi:hypothetical protein
MIRKELSGTQLRDKLNHEKPEYIKDVDLLEFLMKGYTGPRPLLFGTPDKQPEFCTIQDIDYEEVKPLDLPGGE